ncbi:MAG: site-specific integrase [Odoribacter sp.]|nr:site-specific integrase [Odoribacter sp.]
MATVKVVLRWPDNKNCIAAGNLYYRIIHHRRIRYIAAGFKVAADEWDGMAFRMENASQCRRDYLMAACDGINNGKECLRLIIRRFEKDDTGYSADDIVDAYLSRSHVAGFVSFGWNIVSGLRQAGKSNAAGHYTAALSSFMRFSKGDVPFDDFDVELLCRYQYYLDSRGLCRNTTSYYMRNLRAIFNRAVDNGLTLQNYPFRRVYTGIAQTRHRSVPVNMIKALRDLDLSTEPPFELARDMFLFSFYTRGMSVIDMAFLKKSDLKNGMLTYRRKKTGRELTIKWEAPMQAIVRRHITAGSDFLLPLIKNNEIDYRRQYMSAAHLINRYLKKLGIRLGISIPLTLYCARHSWASIALDNDVPVSVISSGMGHDSEKTTRIYLASLDSSRIDIANNSIIRLLDD